MITDIPSLLLCVYMFVVCTHVCECTQRLEVNFGCHSSGTAQFIKKIYLFIVYSVLQAFVPEQPVLCLNL